MEYVADIVPALGLQHILSSHSSPPITKIPPELLGEIFTKYLDDEPRGTVMWNFQLNCKRPQVSPFTTANPIVLGQVCSAWRTISVNMSSLWSSIVILMPDLVPVKLVELWLERTNGAPLDLELRVPPWPSTTAPYDIIRLFFLHSASWRSIQFRALDEDLTSITKLVDSSAPCSCLQSMSFGVTESDSPEYEGLGKRWYFRDVDKFARFCHASPSLRKIRIPSVKGCLFFDHTPTSQLTSLDIVASGMHQEDLPRILSLSPLLEELSIFFARSFQLMSNHKSQTLRFLRRLNIRTITGLEIDILPFLILPVLRSLSIDWQWGAPLKNITVLQDLLRRSECHLKHLSLEHRGIDEHVLEQHLLMPELVSLQSLFLRHTEITDRIVDRLLEKDSNGGAAVLPSLEKLELGPWKASDGQIRRFLKERCRLPRECSRPGVIVHFRPLECTPYGPLDRAFLEETYPWQSLDKPI